jgi:hypothetical protein
MTILIELNDGNETEQHIYRKIAQHNYSAYVAGFYANRDNYKWGVMTQLKGKQRITLHAFGSK